VGIVKGSPDVIKIGFEKDLTKALSGAARVLLEGGLVAFPTESFYGLAVDATREKAIERLFEIKGRDFDQPILVLIPQKKIPPDWVRHIPPVAGQLIKKYWPGGLTLVFEAGPSVSHLLTSNTGKIGIRCSGHPLARALARSAGVPITGTSANISGKSPCRSADEVVEALGGRVDLVLDGGKTEGTIGSTILDVTVDPPLILRRGLVEPDF
jgi:L-threonylcarbamoyladenylate synthase